ncbi:MAG: hypothetical protein EXS18_00285 [Verrucomicrobiae bacterium]|nr:hypothetical protein [Verrucomicrobiae bacterium]
MKILSLLVAVLFAAGSFVVFADDAVKKDEVEIKGKVGCAHCQYHKADSCAVGFKTEDGKVYLMEKADKKLMDARFKGGEYKVTGKVTEKDGKMYVAASKVEEVK